MEVVSPWEPVREGDKLYGRGGADDGYSSFASLAATGPYRTMVRYYKPAAELIAAGEIGDSAGVEALSQGLAGEPRETPRERHGPHVCNRRDLRVLQKCQEMLDR